MIHYRTCNLCEAMCGLAIEVEDTTIRSIRGDQDDLFSRGHICPKAVALQDLHTDPDRLKYPVRRTASGWEQLGWDDAFDLVAAQLKAIQAAHGNDAVGVYQGNPSTHNYGTMLFAPGFVRALQTKQRFSATSVDQLPHQLVAHWMFGHQLLLPIPDLDRTDFFLILGANPAVSNGSLMTAPDVKRRLQAIRERGGRVVVIDPRRTETAALADEHQFIVPGTDAWLLLALLHVIVGENLARPDRLASFCTGLDQIADLVAPWTPELVAPITGIESGAIRQLAHAFAAAPRAVCYGRIGVSIQAFGTLSQWLINLINILTGNLDRPGGAMFTRPAVDTLRPANRGSLGRWQSRIRQLPEFSGELPVVTMAEEILTPGPGQLRALVTSAGNPVLSTPNGQRLDAALATLDFMVSIDFYINETTRHAHIILPPTSSLEHDHYDLVFHLLAIRNTAKYDPAIFAPAPDTRHDWQIFQALTERLSQRRADGSLTTPAMLLDAALKAGPYDLDLAVLQAAPHGIDLGPLQPCLPARLFTSDQHIQLVPAALVQDLVRLQANTEPEIIPPAASFRLIGRRHLRSNNSWLHNSQRLVKGSERCTLLLHPTDAARLGIANGTKVHVSSHITTITATAEITDTIMPGTVSLPHGWGHQRPGVQLSIAQQHPGVSINDLTDEQVIDPVSGNAALNGQWVQIAPITPVLA